MSEPGAERIACVLLVNRTDVTARGVRRQSWRVRHNDGWLSLEQCLHRGMGKSVESRRALPPGCQSLRAVQLNLPVGAELERVLSEPDLRRVSSLDRYLGAGAAPRTLTQCVLYRVGSCGKLKPAAARGTA